MSSRSDGQVIVITGAARGVGARLAEVLATRGARVALLGLEPALLQTQAGRVGHGARAWTVDVTDSTALTRVAAEVLEAFGRIDVVVANAGIASGGTLAVADPDAYDRTLEVNLLGSVRTVRAFLPAVIAARGYVLQVASMAAMVPTPMMSAYGASKAGAEAFAHALRAEVRHHGVDVGVAYLSWTDTDMVRGADEIPALAATRAALPWPFDLTFPLEPAVVRIADGIGRRSPHIYGQAWLRAVQPFRPLLAGLGRFVGDRVAGPEAELAAGDRSALRPVGAGGAANKGRNDPPIPSNT